MALGEPWVHLRLCLTCGHVGCCNESPRRHAERHFLETGHPVMRSFEPDEDWLWCYVDNILLDDETSARADDESSKEFLRRHQLFTGLSEEDLDRLYSMAKLERVPAGSPIMEEGAYGDTMYVILDGEAEVTKRSGQQDVLLGIRNPGEIVGEMALLEKAPRSATVRATEDSLLLSISQTAFETLLACSNDAAVNILRTMTARLRSQEGLVAQQQKLVALGTLSAGLAHELNNPAAAIRRAAVQLGEALHDWETATAEIGRVGLPEECMQAVETLQREIEEAATTAALGPLERSEREDAVSDWLEDRGVDRAWELAPSLVAAGWDDTTLNRLSGEVDAGSLPAVIRWVASRLAAGELLEEVRASSEAISAIVGGVKEYSHLDQAPVQEVDIRKGLETTLMILKHKLKDVHVSKQYAENLPEVEAFGSELNQVWTNLIDNAVDAMDEHGELVLRAFPEGDSVVVEIEDHGPGIPPELHSRVFDAFFTTKAPGKGTGQGLHVVYSIVTQRHRGKLDLRSEPGKTVFRVELPQRMRHG
jgi:signal transduction histidine kinase